MNRFDLKATRAANEANRFHHKQNGLAASDSLGPRSELLPPDTELLSPYANLLPGFDRVPNAVNYSVQTALKHPDNRRFGGVGDHENQSARFAIGYRGQLS